MYVLLRNRYMWTKPLLDTAARAGVLDFLDFHAYDQETNSVIHDMMLALYSLSPLPPSPAAAAATLPFDTLDCR